MGSWLYNAGQKLIDLKNTTKNARPRDAAIILLCARLFNECFAGRLVIERGLVTQAIVLLRSALEITNLALLIMEDEAVALQWLKGGRISPRTVRSKSPSAAARKDLYQRLSDIGHPNRHAVPFYSAYVPERQAAAISYGGALRPRATGQIHVQFLFAQLVFLEHFYHVYEQDLAAQNLLWKGNLPRTTGDGMEITWPVLLGMIRTNLTALAEKYNALPEDAQLIVEDLM